jgi:acyl-CoA synthetase (AMP-forming)/AMP-acid ligase II
MKRTALLALSALLLCSLPLFAQQAAPSSQLTQPRASPHDTINVRVGAKFQRVSDVLILEEFPRTIAGKTLKRVLQEQYRKG